MTSKEKEKTAIQRRHGETSSSEHDSHTDDPDLSGYEVAKNIEINPGLKDSEDLSSIPRSRSEVLLSSRKPKHSTRRRSLPENSAKMATDHDSSKDSTILEEMTADSEKQDKNSFQVVRQELESLEKSLTDTKAENSDLKKEVHKLHSQCDHDKCVEDALKEQSENCLKSVDSLTKERESLTKENESLKLELSKALRAAIGTLLTIPSEEVSLTETKLGGGSYGEVRVAYWLGCPVAVKMMHDELTEYERNIDLFRQEAILTWKTHHPNVTSVCGVVLELEDKTRNAWLVMELLEGTVKDVLDVSSKRGVGRLTLREIIDLAYDSLCGICYLHSPAMDILHGDIRPTNILVTATMTAKLADLGAARLNNGTLSAGMVSPPYTAPERLDGRCSRKSKETDIYSMGVSTCEIFTGDDPDRKKRLSQIEAVSNEEVKSLCKRMVHDDPESRPSAVEALAVLDLIKQTEEYKDCPPKRMVRGITDGKMKMTLTDSMYYQLQ